MSKTLDKLRELTNKLSFPPAHKYDKCTGLNFHKFEGGDAQSTCLFIGEKDLVGVHNWLVKKGTIISTHIHPTKEWIIVYEGVLKVIDERGEKILKSGDSIYINAKKPHKGEVLEDCRWVTVTVPTEPSFSAIQHIEGV